MTRALIATLVLGVCIGCTDAVLLHNLDEQTANKVILELETHGVPAGKQVVTGGRDIAFHVTVSPKDKRSALEALERAGLQRVTACDAPETDPTAVFSNARDVAERIRAQKERDVGGILRMVPGIVEVKLSLATPESDPLAITRVDKETKASVMLKYLPGSDGSKPLSEPQVRAIVAGAVEGLAVENVVVGMVPKLRVIPPLDGTDDPPPPPFLHLLVGLAGAVVLLGLLSIGLALRLRRTRVKLVAMQAKNQGR